MQRHRSREEGTRCLSQLLQQHLDPRIPSEVLQFEYQLHLHSRLVANVQLLSLKETRIEFLGSSISGVNQNMVKANEDGMKFLAWFYF